MIAFIHEDQIHNLIFPLSFDYLGCVPKGDSFVIKGDPKSKRFGLTIWRTRYKKPFIELFAES